MIDIPFHEADYIEVEVPMTSAQFTQSFDFLPWMQKADTDYTRTHEAQHDGLDILDDVTI